MNVRNGDIVIGKPRTEKSTHEFKKWQCLIVGEPRIGKSTHECTIWNYCNHREPWTENQHNVCTYLNAFVMVISNIVMIFQYFWKFLHLCDIFDPLSVHACHVVCVNKLSVFPEIQVLAMFFFFFFFFFFSSFIIHIFFFFFNISFILYNIQTSKIWHK